MSRLKVAAEELERTEGLSAVAAFKEAARRDPSLRAELGPELPPEDDDGDEDDLLDDEEDFRAQETAPDPTPARGRGWEATAAAVQALLAAVPSPPVPEPEAEEVEPWEPPTTSKLTMAAREIARREGCSFSDAMRQAVASDPSLAAETAPRMAPRRKAPASAPAPESMTAAEVASLTARVVADYHAAHPYAFTLAEVRQLHEDARELAESSGVDYGEAITRLIRVELAARAEARRRVEARPLEVKRAGVRLAAAADAISRREHISFSEAIARLQGRR